MLAGEPAERLARNPEAVPLCNLLGAEPTVEPNRRLVPRQDSPVHALASARGADTGNVREQAVSDAAAAPLRLDEHVFEVDAGPAREGRKRSVEHRKADGLLA